jgi:nucleotide-binding universal stress UspA family protein
VNFSEGDLFKRILLCYDGSPSSRAVLQRGADLGVLLSAHVHLLVMAPPAHSDPMLLAAALGTVCVADDPYDLRVLLTEPVEWLRARGVEATGQIASGNMIDEIVIHAMRFAVDLIVLGHYPQASGGSWWSSERSGSLAERAHCCGIEGIIFQSPAKGT